MKRFHNTPLHIIKHKLLQLNFFMPLNSSIKVILDVVDPFDSNNFT